MEKRPTVVIGTLNSKYIHSSLAPWYLLAAIRTCCDTVQAIVVEGTINESLQEVALRIAEKHPFVVGLGCYIWNIEKTYELIGLLKRLLPEVIIVLGGPEVSYNAMAVLMDHPDVDYIVSGEGEKPFSTLINALLKEGDFHGIPGVSYRLYDSIVEAEPYVCLEDPPDAYLPEYFDALCGRIAYVETSRGCPFSCAFCLSGRCGTVRYFDMDRATRDLLRLAQSGTRTIKFVDRTFNANRRRSIELFDWIIRQYGNGIPKGVCFHFEIAGDQLDEETIGLLSSAPKGAIQLEIGLQSFHAKTLESVFRKTDIERLTSNIQKLIALENMHIHLDLIAGLPEEDWITFVQSFNKAYELQPHMLQLGFLKLLHGSTMREKPKQFPCEYSSTPPYEVICTPSISDTELKALHYVEEAVDRLYNSGRFRRSLRYLMDCGYAPFELFLSFGTYCQGKAKREMSLDDYTTLFFEYFSAQLIVDRMALRDAMVCDRLSTNASGLPKVLRIEDPALSRVKAALNQNDSTRQQKGIKRGVALLYTENCAVYADYRDRDPVTGEYRLIKCDLAKILSSLEGTCGS